MNVRINNLPPCRIAYMRQIGPYGPENAQLMRKFKKWATSHNLLNGTSILLGIAHDNPAITPAGKCRYDTCLVIDNDFKLNNEVRVTTLAGGPYAITRVEHTQEAILKAWRELIELWLPDNKYQMDNRPSFERYSGLKNGSQAEPERVELCIPVIMM